MPEEESYIAIQPFIHAFIHSFIPKVLVENLPDLPDGGDLVMGKTHCLTLQEIRA